MSFFSFKLIFPSFSIDRDDFEWTIWDTERAKSYSHIQQRRKPICNCGIDPRQRNS